MTASTTGSGGLLAALDIHKSFGGVHALTGVTVEVPAGQITGLIGPNGSGKTTLFNCISGFETIDAGRVLWRGRDVTGLRPEQLARMGIVRTFQHVMVFAELTLRESLLRAAHCWRSLGRRERPNTGIDNDPAVLLAMGGLTTFADQPVGTLSYGQQRLVNVAMAAAAQPWMLMLDEPVAGLNPEEARQLAVFIRRLRDTGTTPLVIDHNVPFMAGLCDHIIVIDAGRNLTQGSPDEIRRNPDVLEIYLGHNYQRQVARPLGTPS